MRLPLAPPNNLISLYDFNVREKSHHQLRNRLDWCIRAVWSDPDGNFCVFEERVGVRQGVERIAQELCVALIVI